MEMRKVTVEAVEWYPYLAIGEPRDEYDAKRAVEVPDELYARMERAESELREAKVAILRYLRDEGRLSADAAEEFGWMLDEE